MQAGSLYNRPLQLSSLLLTNACVNQFLVRVLAYLFSYSLNIAQMVIAAFADHVDIWAHTECVVKQDSNVPNVAFSWYDLCFTNNKGRQVDFC